MVQSNNCGSTGKMHRITKKESPGEWIVISSGLSLEYKKGHLTAALDSLID